MNAMTATKPLLSDAPLGEVSVTGDAFDVVFRRHLRAPIEKVWAALTVPERLADWFAQATVDLRVGGTLSLDWGGENRGDMRITVCEPPRSFAWVWGLGGSDTLVRFDLAPAAGGTEVTLSHTGVPRNGGAGVRAGWHAHLEGLADAVEGHPAPWALKNEREAALRPLYPKLSD